MPLSAVIPILTAGFVEIFEHAPSSTAEAATSWAEAYGAYCGGGGVTVLPPRQEALASALEEAFNADGGTGAAGVLLALAAFWPATAVPGMAPNAEAVLFTPTGDLSLVVPGVADAKPAAQAEALAAVIHALTIASVKVLIPPSTTPVPIV